MSENVDQLIRQITLLSSLDKKELFEKLGKGIPGIGLEHRSRHFIGESIKSTTINFAPTPGACPRCGRA